MPGSGGCFMKRVLARHTSVLQAIPTTNWNWSQKAFSFPSRNLFLVLVWIIFRNVSVLMVVHTKLQNIKCPWKHRDLHPKQAFLTPEIGGIKNGNEFALKPTSQYYFQVQLQMFVSELTSCIFVVWTNKGIFTVEVLYNPGFTTNVQNWRSFGPVRFFHS